MAEKKYKSLRADLRPFGWGIRDIDIIPPDTDLDPDSVGSEEIKDGDVQMQDLSQKVQQKLNDAVDQQTVTETVNTAIDKAVKEASEESIRDIVKDWHPETEGPGE